ncbi:hypothetical protein DFH07DRAFT_764431 [Mycena maculata]|uniref:Uncharacterized protein n=1 Tax=Mycena maculata TaxID=230809 RepID=A0AAD7KBI8_9AGAR|nr:hypothetical protein DFH07DRAFT_764431 [Mycena maculata]
MIPDGPEAPVYYRSLGAYRVQHWTEQQGKDNSANWWHATPAGLMFAEMRPIPKMQPFLVVTKAMVQFVPLNLVFETQGNNTLLKCDQQCTPLQPNSRCVAIFKELVATLESKLSATSNKISPFTNLWTVYMAYDQSTSCNPGKLWPTEVVTNSQNEVNVSQSCHFFWQVVKKKIALLWAYGKYTVQKDFTSSRDGCNNNFAFGTQILDNLTKLQLQNCSNSGFQNFPMDNFAWVQLQQDATLKCNGCNFRQGHLIEESTLL